MPGILQELDLHSQGDVILTTYHLQLRLKVIGVENRIQGEGFEVEVSGRGATVRVWGLGGQIFIL